MIGPGSIVHAEKAAVGRAAKGAAESAAKLVRNGLNAVALSAVRSNGRGLRARAAASDRANLGQRAGGRGELVQAAVAG